MGPLRQIRFFYGIVNKLLFLRVYCMVYIYDFFQTTTTKKTHTKKFIQNPDLIQKLSGCFCCPLKSLSDFEQSFYGKSCVTIPQKTSPFVFHKKLPAHNFKCEEIMKAFSFWLNYPFNRLPDLLLNNPLNKICEINSTHQTENVINVSICFPHGSFAPLI